MLFFTAIPTHGPGLRLESGGWIPAWPGTRCSGSRHEQVPAGRGGPGVRPQPSGEEVDMSLPVWVMPTALWPDSREGSQ